MLLTVLLNACSGAWSSPAVASADEDAPVFAGYPLARARLTLVIDRPLQPDSGELVFSSGHSIWRSHQASGRAVYVVEETNGRNTRGSRYYEFDSTGVLRYFSEQRRYVNDSGATTRAAGEGWIEFVEGQPVLLARVSEHREPIRYPRSELHLIARRAYALWDSAVAGR
jgi:hypothetical protein